MKTMLIPIALGLMLSTPAVQAGSPAPLDRAGRIFSSCAADIDNLCNIFTGYCKASMTPTPTLDATSRTYMDGSDVTGASVAMRGEVSIHDVPGGYAASLSQFEVTGRNLQGPTFGWQPSLFDCYFTGDKTKAHRLSVIVQTGAANDPNARYIFSMYLDPAVSKTRWSSSAGMLSDSALAAAGQIGTCTAPPASSVSKVKARFKAAFANYDGARAAKLPSPCRAMGVLMNCQHDFESIGETAIANSLHEAQLDSGCLRRPLAPAAAGALSTRRPSTPAI